VSADKVLQIFVWF